MVDYKQNININLTVMAKDTTPLSLRVDGIVKNAKDNGYGLTKDGKISIGILTQKIVLPLFMDAVLG